MPLHFSMAATSLESQRKTFSLAEKMLKKGNDDQFFILANSIKDYPLYPYLEYHWLAKHLNASDKIQSFLSEYKNTRYAKLLGLKWQLHLGKHKQWQRFLKHYKPTNNTAIECYYLQASYNTGRKESALLAAKKLWVVGKSQPKACDSIFNTLKQSSYFTSDLLWQRFDAALRNRKVSLAHYVKRLMTANNQKIAQIWLDVHSNPLLIDNNHLLNSQWSQAGNIFSHAIIRLTRKHLDKAITLWDNKKAAFIITPSAQHRVEKKLARTLAYRQDNRAYSRLNQLNNADVATKEWTVRTALGQQNWPNVKQSIDALDKETKQQEKWQYWLARAYEKTGKNELATAIFDSLSANRSYYGYLSADKLNREYQLSDHPIQVNPEMFKQLKNSDDFRIVSELINVKKPLEVMRQWWYAVSKLDKQGIKLAAKYAQALGWQNIAIFTVAKAKYWDAVELRFPMDFAATVKHNARIQHLDPAVIFALIRRESAFNAKVQSPVGARGLMQIMPKTGQQIAKELKQKWRGKSTLLNPTTNVKFGAYYYKKLLNRFDGHYALAAAAYNAGPHRVKRWRQIENTLPADIWVEMIPFKETRAYVSAVLAYAIIYQIRLNTHNLTMKDFMKAVHPVH